jgi:hypothetical protein
VAVLNLCLEESICRSDSCYLRQNRFPDHSLYCIVNSAFAFAVVAVLVLVAFVVDLSLLDNHGAH